MNQKRARKNATSYSLMTYRKDLLSNFATWNSNKKTVKVA